MNQPLVSVVITSYNYAHFIKTAIDSALNQEYPHIEVIVSDNQSTDDTLAVLRQYENDPRVLVNVNPTNIGIMANANKGISLRQKASMSSSCRPMISCYRSTPHASWSLQSSTRSVRPFSETQYLPTLRPTCSSLRNVYGQVPVDYVGRNRVPWLLSACYMCLPSVLFRRSTFERYGTFDETLLIASDWAICMRIASAGEPFAYTAAPLAGVRMHPGQRSTAGYIKAGEELRESLSSSSGIWSPSISNAIIVTSS